MATILVVFAQQKRVKAYRVHRVAELLLVAIDERIHSALSKILRSCCVLTTGYVFRNSDRVRRWLPFDALCAIVKEFPQLFGWYQAVSKSRIHIRGEYFSSRRAQQFVKKTFNQRNAAQPDSPLLLDELLPAKQLYGEFFQAEDRTILDVIRMVWS